MLAIISGDLMPIWSRETRKFHAIAFLRFWTPHTLTALNDSRLRLYNIHTAYDGTTAHDNIAIKHNRNHEKMALAAIE